MKIIIYDFDGTLTPYPITNLGILEKCGFIGGGNNLYFIKLVSDRMLEKNIDIYTSFYETIFDVVLSNGYELTDEVLSIGSLGIKYNNGVEYFLEYMNNKGVYNFVISSGIKCFLENTSISKNIKNIYASTFKYNKNKIIGIDKIINDNMKIACVDDIIKCSNTISFSNIIYIGDGLTDLPVMEYIKKNGGTTIYVGDENTCSNKNSISYFCDKDYSIDGNIYKIINDKFNI